ncbi:hypothetical protein Cva_01641 [Caedimonas varicaedens]|uniref:Uncharacterized protein n=1 Tax=Caedimonas varicaedens TaxID=1629334 RepID=A0A0K8MEN7_9PROT|nr:hypothetical protein Cva_01641 [Caedimonas varicaedens]
MQPNELFIANDRTLWKTYVKKPLHVQASQQEEEFMILSLAGKMRGKAGDYVIKGIEGELYPCDKRIFEKSYTLLTPQEDTPMQEEAQPLAIENNELKIIYRDLKYFLRRLLARILPARAPQDYDKVDPVTNLHIRVKTSAFYVTFSVNERDFYWDRWSGKFDGTSSFLIYQHPGKSDVEPIKVNLPFDVAKDNTHDSKASF